MSDTEIDDSFEDDNFEDDADARLVDEPETIAKARVSSLEKRRLIDNLLEEKRLERSLRDGFEDVDDKELTADLDSLDEDWEEDDFDASDKD